MTVNELRHVIATYPELGSRPVLFHVQPIPADYEPGDRVPVRIAFDADGALLVELLRRAPE